MVFEKAFLYLSYMKKLVAILFLSLIVSCSKTDPPSNNNTNIGGNLNIPLGTMTADVQGISTNFSFGCEADTATHPVMGFSQDFGIYINGKQNPKDGNGTQSIQIWIDKTPSLNDQGLGYIGVGTYPRYRTATYDTEVVSMIFYDTCLYKLYGTTETANIVYNDFTSVYKAPMVTIISVDDSTVKGTFDCDMVRQTGYGDPMTIKVTNGKFYVPIKK